MKRLQVPEELKLEHYERRRYTAVFDRLDLVIEFRPGKNAVGAIVKSFLDAISGHDQIVVKIENQMEKIKEFKRIYRKRNRLFRNLDSAWNLMMTNINDFNEYQALLSKMDRIEERLELITDPQMKAKMRSQYERFKELEPVCSRQQAVYELYAEARDARDEASRTLVAAEQHLSQLREEEKYLATLISDDHVIADELKKSLTQCFPNVHVGYVLSAINNQSVEDLPFEHILNHIRRANSPHHAEFRRYDYRFDPFSGEWHSLSELRELGVCVEDPLLQQYAFIAAAAKGDKQQVYGLLMQGEDPNCVDITGNSALVVAAANHHTEVVDLLHKAGAYVDQRDKNFMTPLLYCVNRGHVEVVRQLIDLGADKQSVDRNQRDTLFYAILSGNLQMVKWFLTKGKLNKREKLWGFTPLHLAVSQGNMTLVDFFLSSHASIYILDKKGRTAEQIAQENGHTAIFERLRDERLNAPAQVVFTEHVHSSGSALMSSSLSVSSLDSASSTSSVITSSIFEIWIGDIGALDPLWCSDVEFSHIIYFRPMKSFPRQTQWLRAEKEVNFESFVVPMHDEDGDMNDNWDALQEHIQPVFDYVKRESQRCSARRRPFRLLLCDDNGIGIAPAMACIVLLLRNQSRVKETKLIMIDKRPSVEFRERISKGLDNLQKALDDKVLKRLNQRMRGTVVNSIAF